MTFEISSIYLFSYGTYWLYIGLNGVFNFFPPPMGTARFSAVIAQLHEMRFILPTVKIAEIVIGLMLLTSYKPKLALLLLAPILFGILFLQLLFNKKTLVLCGGLLVSYILAIFSHNDWIYLWDAF